MSEINISLEGGTSKRLLTAGKYCDRDIVVTASGGGDEEMWEALLNGSITELNSDVTSVTGYACYRRTSLVKVNMPNATKVLLYGFEGCTALEEVYLPEALTFGNKAFYNCKALKTVYLPKTTSCAIECFAYCTSLERIDLPKATSFSRDCFNSCTNLHTLILRVTKEVSAAASNVLEATAIAAGNGYVYVPASQIDTYKADSRWGVYAAQFRALEDFTVDGTVTGELDENKI